MRALVVGAALAWPCIVTPAWAQISGQLYATKEDGYGRLILSFPGRDSLPE